MRKRRTNLLLSVFALALASCTNSNTNGTPSVEESSSQQPVVKEIVFSNVPSAEISAELGEKCDIPEVIASRGATNLEVSISVKDSLGKEVEVLGRGTRFMADDVNGYTIIYTAADNLGSKSVEVKVNVKDTTGPDVQFDQDVNDLCVTKGSVVTIPTPTWVDNSGTIKNSIYKVTYNGNEVSTENNQFIASEYGIYQIEYYAEDTKGNSTTKIVNVDCARTIVLNDFNDLSNVWADESLSSLTSEHALEGNAFQVTGNDTWIIIAVYPKYYDLSGFDKLQLSVYASKDMDTGEEGLYLLNQKFSLSEGYNTITISKEEFAAQYENGKIPSENPNYYDNQFIWFQLKSNGGSVYLDNFVGIFNNYTADTVAPTIDFGKAIAHDKMTIGEGTVLTIPNAVGYDNSMEEVTLTHAVYNKNQEDITASVDANTYLAQKDEEYTITYFAKDINNNESSKSIKVSVEPKAIIPDTAKEVYFPNNRIYDMLNDFESTGVDWCVVDKEFVNEHVMSGSSAIKLSTTKADQCVVLKMLKDGQPLSTADFEKYEYVQVYVYADSANARFDFYGNTHYLNEGPNVVTITSAELLIEIAKASNVYDATGGFYFQLTTGTVYVDAMIGIYPEGYNPSLEPNPEPNPKPDEIVNYYPTDREYDTLQDFETSGSVDTWFFAGSEGLTTEYAVTDHSFHISGDANYSKLPIMMLKDGQVLTSEDWNQYESFKIAIYSETSAQFCFLNQIYTLEVGYNVITITKDELLAQINSNAECYTASGYFWCQVNGAGVSLYLDAMIGIYPEG